MVTEQVKTQLEESNIARHELAIVNTLFGIMKSNRDTNEAFADSVNELRQVVDVDWASVILIRDEEAHFFALSSKKGSDWKAGDIVSMDRVGLAWLVDNKKALVEPDLTQERRFPADQYLRRRGLRSVVYLPLLDKGEVFGALIIASIHPSAYKKKELAFLEHISSHVAGVIKIIQIYEEEVEKRKKLESEERERLQFLNALAHELKTPLTAIVASAGLLMEEIDDKAGSPRVRLTENIIRAIEKLEARLSELLDMARIGIHGFKLDLELLDPLPLVQNVVSELLPVAVERKQALTLVAPEGIPMLWVDKQRFEQILVNLVTNAIKFTWEGDSIEVRIKKAGGELVVEVEDHGPGITSEEQERVFQPYYRIEADRQRFTGLGLGLALSKQLVELHRGRLWVLSEYGIGSIFAFSLPIKKPR